jgi:hypothetical protein
MTATPASVRSSPKLVPPDRHPRRAYRRERRRRRRVARRVRDSGRPDLAVRAASRQSPRRYGRDANRFCIEAERAARHAAIRNCPVARSDLSPRGSRAAGKSSVQASVGVVVSPPERCQRYKLAVAQLAWPRVEAASRHRRTSARSKSLATSAKGIVPPTRATSPRQMSSKSSAVSTLVIPGLLHLTGRTRSERLLRELRSTLPL